MTATAQPTRRPVRVVVMHAGGTATELACFAADSDLADGYVDYLWRRDRERLARDGECPNRAFLIYPAYLEASQ